MRYLAIPLAVAASPVLAAVEVQVSCDFEQVCLDETCLPIRDGNLWLALIWSDWGFTFAPVVGDSRLLAADVVLEDEPDSGAVFYEFQGAIDPITSAHGFLESPTEPNAANFVLGFEASGISDRRLLTIRLDQGSTSTLAFVNSGGSSDRQRALATGRCNKVSPP